MHPALTPAPTPCWSPTSPVVAAVGPCQLHAWAVPLPGQLVQAATVAGRHTNGPTGTQQLAWGAVTAGLAVPHTVLGDSKRGLWSAENRTRGGGAGVLGSQRRAAGGKGKGRGAGGVQRGEGAVPRAGAIML